MCFWVFRLYPLGSLLNGRCIIAAGLRLEEKILWLLEHRDYGINIALNCYQHYLKYHTTKAKAQYVIDICKQEGLI